MHVERKQRNQNTINLAVDSTIFVAFLIAMAPHFSGTAVHEWLSIAFGAAIITHLLLHWQWLVEVTKRFFTRTQWSARINYLLNTLLFIAMTIVIFTGLMISEVALPVFGVHMASGGVWRGLHETSANVVVIIVGLHIALHWQWIVNTVKRYVIAPLLPRRRAPQPALGTTHVEASEMEQKV